MQEIYVELPQGRLAVQAYGGSGPDVLFVHSIGFCGPQWRHVARALSDRCRTFSFDLPGHAHSTLPMAAPADQWRHLPAIVEKAGLRRPVLVGHDSGTWVATVAALHHPELFSALVLVGGSMQRYVDASGLAQDPAFQASLVDRFHLGATGADEASLQAFLELMAAAAPGDDMMSGLEAGIYEETEHSVTRDDAGGWMNTPTVPTVLHALSFDDDDPDLPDDELYSRLGVPTWVVALSDGFDANVEQQLDGIREENTNVQLRVLTTGQWPQYTDVAGIAAVVAEAAGV